MALLGELINFLLQSFFKIFFTIRWLPNYVLPKGKNNNNNNNNKIMWKLSCNRCHYLLNE
jgi:hypothetical protein